MAKRIKTIPAIEPNAGLKAALQKRLIALIEKQTREATAELLRNLIDSGCFTQPVETVAQDAALWGRKEKKIIDEAIRAFKASNPADAARKLDLSLTEKMARWMIHAGESAKLVSGWFVRAMAQNVTASQRRALIRAGITPTLLKEKWAIPIVKNRYIAPSTAKALPGLVDGMTGLITKMQADDLARVRETITRGLYEGQSLGEIESVLKASRGFTEARADQSQSGHPTRQRRGIGHQARGMGSRPGAVFITRDAYRNGRQTLRPFRGALRPGCRPERNARVVAVLPMHFPSRYIGHIEMNNDRYLLP